MILQLFKGDFFMKKFSKIIAGILAFSVCASATCFNAFADYDSFDFSGHKGDINSDGVIDAVDASLVYKEYASTSTGMESSFTEEQCLLADVALDGHVDAIDATAIMIAYLKTVTKASDYKDELKNSDSLGNCTSTPDNNFSDAEISESPVKPNITVETVTLSMEEANMLVANNEAIPVNIYISGSEGKYCSTGLGITFHETESGKSLRAISDYMGNPEVESGEAVDALVSYGKSWDSDSAFLATTGSGNYGTDGLMYTINFKLPKNIESGDFFPVCIEYCNTGDASSLFTNCTNDETGKLMQAYLFTQGITNGGIQIESKKTTGNSDVVAGDATDDGEVNIADAVLIMQTLSNPNDYKLDKQQKANADVVNQGDGVTAMDALAIQLIGLKLVTAEDFPITIEQLDSLTK